MFSDSRPTLSRQTSRRQRARRMALCLTLVLGSAVMTACSIAEPPPYTPPTQRGGPLPVQAWPRNHYLAIAWHDVEDDQPDQTFVSVSTTHLQQQFAWLRENGYRPVSVEQILQASNGGTELPERAVLLSFDDGYQSFYTRVYPLLRAFNWPAVLAPVGVWVDPPTGASVNFGGLPVPRERFLTWPQIREMSASGLVEIAAHTNNLHYGITANPQGNQQPAAAARRYDVHTERYESDEQYRQRIADDVRAISQKIRQATGKPPRAWVWPYGTTSGLAARVIRDHGYSLLLTLDDGLASDKNLTHAPRLLIANDPTLPGFANAVIAQEKPQVMRAVQIAIDDVDDPDPQRADQKLGALIQTIADLQITSVILEAARPGYASEGDTARAYFPNRQLPVQADLFNRVAWQLRSRAFVDVFAYLPAKTLNSTGLSPEAVIELYEDLARHAVFAGIVLDDDLQANGLREPDRKHVDQDIIARVKALRGDETLVARTIDLRSGKPSNNDTTRLDLYLDSADWILVRAGQQRSPSDVRDLAAVVNSSKSPERLVITLDPDQNLASNLRQLQSLGIRNMAYAPSSFNPDAPRLLELRPVLSNAWYPAK